MKKSIIFLGIISLVFGLINSDNSGIAAVEQSSKQEKRPGYDNTPFIPGSRWRVHDSSRPRPVAVNPGDYHAVSEKPPSDAIVLFDGRDLSQWTGKTGQAGWKVVDGTMEVVKKAGNIQTRKSFGSCQLHIEWRTPEVVVGEGQGRGNSGVFLMGRYEIQVLDSYNNPTYADGQAAAIYGQMPPLVNASRPPGKWQTYDIMFEAPVFEGEKLVIPAYVTVIHNGVLVHHHQKILGPTAHKKILPYKPHGPAPLLLQDHGNPVRYRNIWIRPLD